MGETVLMNSPYLFEHSDGTDWLLTIAQASRMPHFTHFTVSALFLFKFTFLIFFVFFFPKTRHVNTIMSPISSTT